MPTQIIDNNIIPTTKPQRKIINRIGNLVLITHLFFLALDVVHALAVFVVVQKFFFASSRLRDSKRIYHKVTKDTKNHEGWSCHSERSEESPLKWNETLRCAQSDKIFAVIAVFAVVKAFLLRALRVLRGKKSSQVTLHNRYRLSPVWRHWF